MNFTIENILQTVLGKVETWWETFISMIPNMAVAIVLLLFLLCFRDMEQNFLEGYFTKLQKESHSPICLPPLYNILFWA